MYPAQVMVEWMQSADGRLWDWPDVDAEIPVRNLLLGNGASLSLWGGFDYESLYDRATTANGGQLLEIEQRLFTELDTKNFELVLSALVTARRVAKALAVSDQRLINSYDHIRDALISGVMSVHLPWKDDLRSALRLLKTEFANHKTVFTTNYDLIAYWTIMLDGAPQEFGDYFYDGDFHREQTTRATQLLFLHGGLHLVKRDDGSTGKRSGGSANSLLDTFHSAFDDGSVPLLVSEGTSADKLRAIRQSDYLSFAIDRLEAIEDPLVVFGHSLNPEFDRHLVEAITRSSCDRVAVGMRPGPRAAFRQGEFLALLSGLRVAFFDATTHPLGAGDLHQSLQSL